MSELERTTLLFGDDLFEPELVPRLHELAQVPVYSAWYPANTTMHLMVNHYQRQVIDQKPYIVVIQAGGEDIDRAGDQLRRNSAGLFTIEDGEFIVNPDIKWEELAEDLTDYYWEVTKKVGRNLFRMWSLAHDNGIKPVVVGLLPARYDSLPEGMYNSPRQTTNMNLDIICKGMHIPFVDLYTYFADPTKNELMPEFSDDGYHINREGTLVAADVIYEQGLRPLLMQ